MTPHYDWYMVALSLAISACTSYAALELAGRIQQARRQVQVWRLAGGKPIVNTGPVPAKTPLSEEISKALKKRGFKFVGPVIVYAWMQAAGMVNDHSAECFRRKATRQKS